MLERRQGPRHHRAPCGLDTKKISQQQNDLIASGAAPLLNVNPVEERPKRGRELASLRIRRTRHTLTALIHVHRSYRHDNRAQAERSARRSVATKQTPGPACIAAKARDRRCPRERTLPDLEEAVAQTRLAPVCLWFDHNAGSLGVEVG
jgi:hypothetical protein